MKNSNPLKLVCIGGGTGLSTLLRGFKLYSKSNNKHSELIDMDWLAAIVTVADDGGSTGRLIEEFDVLPPGDIRHCMVALSDEDEIMSQIFSHRFKSNGDLGGHSVGNLLLIALAELSDGSFPMAIEEASKVLAIRGRILPVTLEHAALCAELEDGDFVEGESQIPKRRNREPIERVFLIPRENSKNGEVSSTGETDIPVGPAQANERDYQVKAHQEAVKAIHQADAIVIGPGSLYTSIMPNLVVEEITAAIKESKVPKIYACNIMVQPGETDGYSVSDHINAIVKHADFLPDYVLTNNELAPSDIIEKYMKEELQEHFARIKLHADEAIDTLDEGSGYTSETLMDLIKTINRISEDTSHMVDTSKVQVMYNPEVDDLGDISVIEKEMLICTNIVDRGVEKLVIRHDSEKLANAIVEILWKHSKHETR